MMIMKKQLLLFAMILLPLVASAHDIEVQNADGVTIYYNYINDGTELQVTFRGSRYYDYSNIYQGNVVIPEEVTYMNRTRKVTSIGDYAFVECYGLTSVTIPNSVTSIGYSSFSGCSGLTSITIGNSVTSIGYSSFDGCSGLKKVIVKDIAAWCGINFGNYSSNPLYYAHHIYSDENTEITNLIIPNSVTSIGDLAFYGCSGLTSITIPNSVIAVGNNAFYNTNLSTLIVGSGVLSFGSNAFSTKPIKTIWLTNTPPQNYTVAQGAVNYVANNNYTSLSNKTVYPFLSSMFVVDGIRYVPVSPSERTCDAIDCVYNESAENITIGESVANKGISLNIKNIQPYLCYGNEYIKNVNIKSDYRANIPSNSFCGCTGITFATISNYGSIGDKAFYGCATSGDATFIIENKGYIGTSAFEGCTGITSATISNQGNIEERAFYGCTSLNKVNVSNQGSIGLSAFEGCTGITSATISNQGNIGERAFYGSAKKGDATFIIENKGDIGTSAFEGCTGITSATISNQGNIGNNAFNGCSRLKTATISNQGNIGEEAFYGCATSRDATFIIENKGYIGTSAFEGCSGIISATISNQGNIGEKAFYGCAKNNPATFVINNRGVISKSAFEGCSKMTNVELGEKIPSIGERAFYGCSNLSDIIIPDSVTTIGGYAFDDCFSLSSAKIGNGVKAIPSYTFSGCSSLKDAQIGKNITSIGEYAFNGCSTLPKIQIPKSVNSIANYVFKGCTRLKTVIMDNGDSDLSLSSNGSNPMFADCPLDSVYIGRNITYNTSSSYGYSPFYRNTSLRTVVITDKETEISDNEFYGCTNLQSFKVGDGVTSFGKYAFSGCSSLKSLSFGAKLQSIEQEAFSDCTAITSIVSKVTTPPVCGSQALDDINKWECSLYVPEGTLSAYQAADQWKEFFFIEEGDPFAILRGDANGDGKVDMDDATFVANIILGTEEATEAADVNKDGEVNMSDVMFIINYIKNGKFPDE